jgi:hypothetical protein
MNQESSSNTEPTRWDSGDESEINPEYLRYIKNPTTPPETEAEEL